MDNYDIIGWIGSIAFAVCAAPQAIQCAYQGHTKGLSTLFLSLLWVGEWCYIISVWGKFGFVPWMMLNYMLNVFWLIIIFYYYFFPRH